jgi:hypothetical protein
MGGNRSEVNAVLVEGQVCCERGGSVATSKY